MKIIWVLLPVSMWLLISLRMGFFTNCVDIVVCSDFSAFLCGCLGFLGVFYVFA